MSRRPRQPPSAAKPAAPRSAKTALCLALFSCLVYLANLRPPSSADSLPTRLIPFSLLREGNLDLDEFLWLTADGAVPYFLRRTPSGHLFSRYPVATSLVSAPVAAPFVWWTRHLQLHDDDVRFRLATLLFERLAAALIAALSVALVYCGLCRLTASSTAAWIALVYAFGSSTWGTSSQALWQHGLAELGLAGLSSSLLLLAASPGQAAAALAGACAALGVLARPTMLVFAALALLYVGHRHRAGLPAFLALPALAAAALLSYNLGTMSSMRGGYGDIHLGAPRLEAAIGLLISPNRGLFVFTPVALLAIPAMSRWRRHRSPWLPYLTVGCIAYVIFYSTFAVWWGGATYGPRFLVDLLPALALLAVPAVESLFTSFAGRTTAAALAIWSIAVQAIGVYGGDYNDWNQRPAVVDGARAWDWRDSEILRTLRLPAQGFRLAPFVWQAWTDPSPVLLRELPAEAVVGEIAVESRTPIAGSPRGLATLSLRLTNRSDAPWPGFSDYGFRDCLLVYLWTPADAGTEPGSIALPRNLHPGESVELSQRIQLPSVRGAYDLRVALVQTIGLEAGIFGHTEANIPVRVR